MVEILTCLISFASESLENFTVCVGFVGMFGWVAKPLPKQAYKPAPPPAKRTKRKGKPKAKRAKVAKPKQPKNEAKKEFELSYTPEQIARIEEMFRRGRGY